MQNNVFELVKRARKLRLEGVEILDNYTITQISRIYNGIGPDSFPDWLREIVTASAGIFEPAAVIHDIEYDRGGSESEFTASNDRFHRNCSTLVKATYAWYDPRRYLWLNKARRWANYCEFFGCDGWGGGNEH